MISYLAPGYPAALFEALAEHIGVELGFEVGRSGPDPLVDPFTAGTADLGWVCSTSLVELTTGRPPSVQEVGVAWVPDDPDAADRQSIVATIAEDGLHLCASVNHGPSSPSP